MQFCNRDKEMSQAVSDSIPNSPPRKKSKQVCIIHYENEDIQAPLTAPKDFASWETLLEAASLRHHTPLLEKAKNLPHGQVPDIVYHRQCRSRFTLKRNLQLLQRIQEHPAGEEFATSDGGKHTTRSKPSTSRVYRAHCIFCEREKYRKGSKTREPIVKCTELQCDKRIRESAIQKRDLKSIAIASRDLLAVEAHYHHSCYRFYTKQPETTNHDSTHDLSHETEENCLYNEAE